ncbi:MAG: trypsin-like peptidase domain-containing protein [Oscillospiraceae bacterium]|nr:trypsin-like peptidase domain-containing protein [Oscillospiraceae bacterium]
MIENECIPQEVVLRYDSAEEVVEVYRQETPLPDYPGRPLPFPAKRRSRRKGLLIFLFLLALLAGVVILTTTLSSHDEDHNDGKSETKEDSSGVFTTIPHYLGEDTAEMTLQPLGGKILKPSDIYQRVSPAVVTVIGTHRSNQSGGTGMIFSENGYILTNAHVIEHCESATVILASGHSFTATLVGYDAEEDLAVLKIGTEEPLPTVTFGDSDDLLVGEPAYAIGNPLGVDLISTFTSGMISGLSREIEVGSGSLRLLQTDTALNSGNSGGPLINQNGQVIGINTAKMQSGFSNVEGIGFAIPTADALKKVNDLIQFGEIQPTPVIGITVAPLTEPTEDGHFGLEVWEVTPGGPGGIAGIAPYDVVIRADGKELHTNDDLLAARDLHKIGDSMHLEICRNGQHFSKEIILQSSK